MTDAAATTPAAPTRAEAATPWSTGARTLVWGFALCALGLALLLIGASSSPDDASDVRAASVLGVIVGAMGLPVLLIGIVAVGVRMGLDDRG